MTETELQHESELADARLGVAEELWWPMAIVTATGAHLKWDNWFLTIALVVAVYFLVTYRYRRAADKAEDEYFRVARLGKYTSPPGEENA
jgi:uncharacterized membrane protein